MLSLDILAEQRIREAQDNGEFDNLPGAGAPLALDDDALVPEELRAAYHLLRNSGFVPPELEPHCEIRSLEQMLQAVQDDDRRNALLSRIQFLLSRRATSGHRRDLRVESAYFETIACALAQGRSPG
jgi:hypothetical protein